MLLFPIVFSAVGILLMFIGGSDYRDYKTAYDTTAIVTKCEVGSTGETSDWNYNIYISYTFDGNEYSDIYLKSQSRAIDIGETISVKISPNNPGQPFSDNPLVLVFLGIPFVLCGIIISFKLIPASFSEKQDFINRSNISNKSKKWLWIALIPVVVSIVFLILGLNINPLFHIGTIIFVYFSVVFIELLSS